MTKAFYHLLIEPCPPRQTLTLLTKTKKNCKGKANFPNSQLITLRHKAVLLPIKQRLKRSKI